MRNITLEIKLDDALDKVLRSIKRGARDLDASGLLEKLKSLVTEEKESGRRESQVERLAATLVETLTPEQQMKALSISEELDKFSEMLNPEQRALLSAILATSEGK